MSASDFANGLGPGKYLTIGDTSGNNHYFWFTADAETDPSPGGIGHSIPFSQGDETYQVAYAFMIAAQNTTLWVGDINYETETITLTTVADGNVINASAGTTLVTVTTIQEGI